MSGIVDSHVHLLPGRLAVKVRAFFDEHISHGRLVYPLEHELVLAKLQEAGIDTVWSLPYAHKGGVATGLNEASARTMAQFKDGPVKVVGGATVHPQDQNPASVVIDAFDKYGLRVLKLHSSVGDFQPDDPALEPVWRIVSERQVPVVVHVGHSVSGHTGAGELGPLERVAQAFPQARIIIAHCAHPAGNIALDLVERYPSVYADLTPVVFEPVALPVERVKHLVPKLLYGSDAPNVGLSVEQSLSHIQKFGLTKEETASILGGTARRLQSEVLT